VTHQESVFLQLKRRLQQYIFIHSERQVKVGCALFGRDRQIFAISETGQKLLDEFAIY
jgi:cobalt-precorrin-5B (C1)-methyltransferase